MPFNLHLPGTAAEHGRATSTARRWRIFWSYLPDWALTIFLWGIFYLLDKVDGYRRLFSGDGRVAGTPIRGAREGTGEVWLLAVTCGVVPAILIILTGALLCRSFWDVHSGILGILALGFTATFTDIVKITAGRPRPDLFSRCQLPADLTSNPIHSLTSWTVCKRTDLLQDGFTSFPSGYASFASCGMWYLILYGAAKMRIRNRRGDTWISWLFLVPLSCCTLISVSRTMDYRHHPTDVIAGSIIGILAAWYSYRQFYPSLAHSQAYKPYFPRVPRDDEIPLHHTDGGRSTDGAQPPHTHYPEGEAGLRPFKGYTVSPRQDRLASDGRADE